MAVKELAFDANARKALLAGVEKLARAVKSAQEAEMPCSTSPGAAPPLPKTV